MITESMTTHNDMVIIRGCLVDELGSYNRAAVWARIEFRANKHNREAVFEDGHWWWRVTLADMSEDVRIGQTALRAHLTALEEGGYIERVEHNGGNGYDHTKSYRPVILPDNTMCRNPSLPDVSESDKSSLSLYEVDIVRNPKVSDDSDAETERLFLDWYAEYPRKDAKGQARKAFKAALKKTDMDTLVRGRDLYVAKLKMDGTERRYIKLPSSWLNGECWDDDYGDVKITPSGFSAWFASALESANTGEVERVLGLVFPMPDEVPAGVSRVEFLDDCRRAWLEDVMPQAESRWVVQFGDVLKGP